MTNKNEPAADKLLDNFKPKDIKKMGRLLQKEFSLKERFTPVHYAKYLITMDNDFLSPNGRIKKKQHLEAEYTRQFEHPLSNSAASFIYTWKEVAFSHQGQKVNKELAPWTFARGLQFGYCKTFTGKCFNEKDDIHWSDDYPVGNWYRDQVNVPAVNLLYMLTWDVFFFEGFNCSLAATSPRRIGESALVSSLSDSYVHLALKGCAREYSFFKNGQLYVRLLGISVYNGNPVCVYEYRSAGRLNVEKQSGDMKQDGESFFLGKIYLDMRNGDVNYGDMMELLTVSVSNKQGKFVPLQKRRSVQLKKLNWIKPI